MNSPRRDLSRSRRLSPAAAAIDTSVTQKQNSTNRVSHAARRSSSARSANISAGIAARNTNAFIPSANRSSTRPARRKKKPSAIMRKTGTVAFRLKARFSMRQFLIVFFGQKLLFVTGRKAWVTLPF